MVQKMSEWVKVEDKPIPVYGKNGMEFMLALSFHEYYGYERYDTDDPVILAIWDSTNECFFEKRTGLKVRDEDILEWYNED